MRHVCMFGHPPVLSKPLVALVLKAIFLLVFIYLFAFLLLSSVFFCSK